MHLQGASSNETHTHTQIFMLLNDSLETTRSTLKGDLNNTTTTVDVVVDDATCSCFTV